MFNLFSDIFPFLPWTWDRVCVLWLYFQILYLLHHLLYFHHVAFHLQRWKKATGSNLSFQPIYVYTYLFLNKFSSGCFIDRKMPIKNTISYTKGRLMKIFGGGIGYICAQNHQLSNLCRPDFAFLLVLLSGIYPNAHGEFMVCRKLCLSHYWSCNPVCSRLH